MARKTQKMQIRNQFFILTNGKTEKNYFKNIPSRKSIYDIKIRFLNSDPKDLINCGVELKNKNNQVWCVFDKDDFSSESIYNAIDKAKRNGVGVAFSNISFEVWLVDHFHKCETEKTTQNLIEELNSLLKNNKYIKGYSKVDENAIKKVFVPRLEDAINNAEIIYQKKILEYKKLKNNEKYPLCEWNSYTDVHKLIKAMRLSFKKT